MNTVTASVRSRRVRILPYVRDDFSFLLTLRKPPTLGTPFVEWDMVKATATYGEWYLDTVARLSYEIGIPGYSPYHAPCTLAQAQPDSMIFLIPVASEFIPKITGAGYGWLREVPSDNRVSAALESMRDTITALRRSK